MNYNSLPTNSELEEPVIKTVDDEFDEMVQEHIEWEELEDWDTFVFYNPDDPFYQR